MNAPARVYGGAPRAAPAQAAAKPAERERDAEREAHLAAIRAGSRWLDADEAAAYLKRSVKTVENMTSAGRLHPRYPDRRPLYDRHELDDVVEKSPLDPPGSTTGRKAKKKSKQEPVAAS